MAASTLKVKGLRELQKALRNCEHATDPKVALAIRASGEPVRDEAQRLAQSRIPTAGSRWTGMKTGSTLRSVYVAPAARRSGGSPRPNFGRMLMDRALMPALDNKQDESLRRFEKALDDIADVFERG